MRDWARICCGLGLVLFVVSIIGAVLLSFVSLASAIGGTPENTGISFFGTLLLFLLFMGAGLLLTAGHILYLVEIVKAKNADDWKVKWFLVVFILSLIGIVAYELAGRKERKA